MAKRAELVHSHLSDDQKLLLEWELRRGTPMELPTDPTSFAEMADQLGVSETTVHQWRKTDTYTNEYRMALSKEIASPMKLKLLAEQLFNKAVETGAPQLTREYIALMDRIDPPKPLEREEVELADLTDDELIDLVFSVAELRNMEIKIINHGDYGTEDTDDD